MVTNGPRDPVPRTKHGLSRDQGRLRENSSLFSRIEIKDRKSKITKRSKTRSSTRGSPWRAHRSSSRIPDPSSLPELSGRTRDVIFGATCDRLLTASMRDRCPGPEVGALGRDWVRSAVTPNVQGQAQEGLKRDRDGLTTLFRGRRPGVWPATRPDALVA